jgi:hypothetical protein
MLVAKYSKLAATTYVLRTLVDHGEVSKGAIAANIACAQQYFTAASSMANTGVRLLLAAGLAV